MSDDFTPAGDYYDPSVDSSVDVGASGPTRGGGGFFDDLLGLARQFVPGVNTAVNIANRIGGVIGGLFSGGGSGGHTPHSTSRSAAVAPSDRTRPTSPSSL